MNYKQNIGVKVVSVILPSVAGSEEFQFLNKESNLRPGDRSSQSNSQEE